MVTINISAWTLGVSLTDLTQGAERFVRLTPPSHSTPLSFINQTTEICLRADPPFVPGVFRPEAFVSVKAMSPTFYYTREEVDSYVNAFIGMAHAPLYKWRLSLEEIALHLKPLRLFIEAGLFDHSHIDILLNNAGHQFIGANLAVLIEKGLLVRNDILQQVKSDSDFNFGLMAEFLKDHLGTLIDANLYDQTAHEAFTENPLRAHAYGGSNTIPILDLWFQPLLEKGRFCEKDARHILTTLRNDEDRVRERISSIAFLEHHLPALVARGWFDPKEDYQKVRERLCQLTQQKEPKSDDSEMKAMAAFYTAQLPVLMDIGAFDESMDYPLLVEAVRPLDHARRLGFFLQNLRPLSERSLVERQHLGDLINFEAHGDDRKQSDQYLARHLPQLAELGLMKPLEAAEMSVAASPLEWIQYAREQHEAARRFYYKLIQDAIEFHTLNAQGFWNKSAFTSFLTHERVTPEMAAYLRPLGLSEDWMSSPMRWRSLAQLFNSYYHDNPLSETLKGLFRFLNRKDDSPDIEEIASLISTLGGMNKDDVKILSQWLGDQEARDADVKNLNDDFEKTGQALGLTSDESFRAMASNLNKTETKTLAIEWHASGIIEVWEKYRNDSMEARQDKDPRAARKVQKRFLNYLQAQATRKRPPSWTRLVTTQVEKIMDEVFIDRLRRNLTGQEAQDVQHFLKSPLWKRFQASRLYLLCRKSGRFMEPEGIDSLRRLLLGIRLEGGRFVYPRYEELHGIVGDAVLEKWRSEYVKEQELSPANTDPTETKRALKKMVVDQVGAHTTTALTENPETIDEVIRYLPDQIQHWLETARNSMDSDETFEKEAQRLYEVFEDYYRSIRAVYGNIFANIRIDLKNFLHGWRGGLKIARRSETFRVSGDIETMARSGSEPVHTCQTLEYAWVNQQGEPIHRLLHGQFKVANWEMDGAVAARRLLEITVDKEGNEHLLVERLYTAGGFGRIEKLREEILEYGHHLDIDPSHVHFDDENSFDTAPPPLRTGDYIYRDSFAQDNHSTTDP